MEFCLFGRSPSLVPPTCPLRLHYMRPANGAYGPSFNPPARGQFCSLGGRPDAAQDTCVCGLVVGNVYAQTNPIIARSSRARVGISGWKCGRRVAESGRPLRGLHSTRSLEYHVSLSRSCRASLCCHKAASSCPELQLATQDRRLSKHNYFRHCFLHCSATLPPAEWHTSRQNLVHKTATKIHSAEGESKSHLA